MGQSKFAWGCALVAGLIVANRATSDDDNPFNGDAPAASAAVKKTEAAPESAQARSRHDAERRIEAILDQPLQGPLDVLETPLSQVMALISEDYDLPIEFDVRALDTIAASPDVEINAQYANMSLRSALEHMLRQVDDLTYIVDNEVLLITTHEEEQRRLETIVYRVDDLGIPEPPMPASAISWAPYRPIVDVVTSCVERNSWMENGTGQGEIQPLGPDLVVISTTRRVHEQIEQLFDEIRRVNNEGVARLNEKSNAAVDRPVTKGIRITQDFAEDTDSQRQLIRDLVMKSVDWTPTGNLTEDDVFFEIIPGRIFVRHLPHVVKQVEDVTRAMELSHVPTGAVTSRFGGTPAAPRKPSEDGAKPQRGGGF